jgi:hypothetical protein
VRKGRLVTKIRRAHARFTRRFEAKLRDDIRMKIAAAAGTAVFLAVAGSAPGVAGVRGEPVRAAISQVAWLAGTWTGRAGDTTFEERWTEPAGGAMLAVSRTIKGARMVGFEFLRIVERDGGLVYIAQPNGRPPTEFVLTALAGESATFESPAHDFPKLIRYGTRPDGGLEARVSDGGRRTDTFVFRRAP